MITAKQFRAIRENLEMSQEEIARALDVSAKTISRWETGESAPTNSSLRRLGCFLYQNASQALPLKVRQKLYSLRREAAHKVHRAIIQGKLPRLTNGNVRCVDCQKKAQHYDHRDYTKPLTVEPVCQGCNFRRGLAVLTLQHIWK